MPKGDSKVGLQSLVWHTAQLFNIFLERYPSVYIQTFIFFHLTSDDMKELKVKLPLR